MKVMKARKRRSRKENMEITSFCRRPYLQLSNIHYQMRFYSYEITEYIKKMKIFQLLFKRQHAGFVTINEAC